MEDMHRGRFLVLTKSAQGTVPCVIEIIGVELYFFVGGNVQVRFNTDTFLGELGVIEIYEE